MTFVIPLCPFSLFGCVCQPKINEYDDDDDDDVIPSGIGLAAVLAVGQLIG